MVLALEELEELESMIIEELPEKLTGILSMANRSGELEELLDMMGMKHLLRASDKLETFKEGKIVVIGASQVKEKELLGVAKKLGLSKERFEFCLDYNEAKNFEYKKLEYKPMYRVIMFGPVPHSCSGKGDSGSVVAEIEKRPDRYPRVMRLESNGELKITKTNFKLSLETLIAEDYI